MSLGAISEKNEFKHKILFFISRRRLDKCNRSKKTYTYVLSSFSNLITDIILLELLKNRANYIIFMKKPISCTIDTFIQCLISISNILV